MSQTSELTQAQKAALIASGESKEYFCETFYTIPDISSGRLTKFKLRPYQKEILGAIDEYNRIIGLKARQIGWTTLAVANALHDALFNEWRPWLFISRNETAAQAMVGKASLAYYRLPPWLRRELPRLTSETKGSLIFDNGSRIESVPATADTGRGDAVYGTLLDEAAFMEYGAEIWGAVEPLTYGVAMMFSTANGMGNHFHDIWLDSQQPDSVWHDIFFPWDVVPARTEEWYEQKRLEHRAQPWYFFQEYPSTPEEAFSKSGRVAFAMDVVESNFEEIWPERRLGWVMGGEPRDLLDSEDDDIVIEIWREPKIREDENGRMIAKPNYVVGVDVAEGLEHGDYSYVTVFDVVNNEQVASCRSHMPVHYLADVVEWLAYYYMKALVVIERNNAGVVPLDQLSMDRYYPRLYRMDRFAEIPTSGVRTPRYGWQTTKKTKPKMVLDFQKALAAGDVVLHDPGFKVEAQTFIADGKGSYGATDGNHDDIVMGTLLAWQGVLDSPSYPIVWRDDKIRPLTHEELDEQIFFAEPELGQDPLNQPIGQPYLKKPKKSFVLMPGNFGK